MNLYTSRCGRAIAIVLVAALLAVLPGPTTARASQGASQRVERIAGIGVPDILPHREFSAMNDDATIVLFNATRATSDTGVRVSTGYLYDRVAGTVDEFGRKPNGDRFDLGADVVAVSSTGRFVVVRKNVSRYSGRSANLFMTDRETGKVELVNRDSSGDIIWLSNRGRVNVQVSDDGNFVLFGGNVRDRAAGQTMTLSSDFSALAMTPDGKYVVYSAGPFGHLSRLNVLTGEADVVTEEWGSGADISADGQIVSFRYARGPNHDQVATRDMSAATAPELITTNAAGAPSNRVPPTDSKVGRTSLSDDGRFVAFSSTATDLVTNPDQAVEPPTSLRQVRVYVFDRELQTMRQITRDAGRGAYFVEISGDGTTVGFDFAGAEKFAPDPAGNGTSAFLVDLEALDATPTCNGLSVTIFGTGEIVGTDGPDVILGSTGSDVIDGGGGDDVICAREGDDIVRGGAGSDLILAGDGHDRVNGQGGADRLYGGPGDDVLFGNEGDDSLGGGAGSDRVIGGPGDDSLGGGDGDDWCRGSAGKDRYFKCETKIV